MKSSDADNIAYAIGYLEAALQACVPDPTGNAVEQTRKLIADAIDILENGY